jgi:hypothetical protein
MARASTRNGAGFPAIPRRPGVACHGQPLPRGRGVPLSEGVAPRASRARGSRARDFTPLGREFDRAC